jgi:hypothetical protein
MRGLLKTALLSLGLATLFLLGGAGKADAHAGEAAEADALDGSTAIQAGACGNAVGVLGDAEASCDGSQDARATAGDETDDGWIDADAGGPTVVQADACGNAVGVGGNTEASCEGSQVARASARNGDAARPVEIDVLRWGLVAGAEACGNALGVLGGAEASCEGSQTARAATGDETDGDRSGADASGPTAVQADGCGNAVGVLGDAEADCDGSQTAPGDGHSDASPPSTGGEGVVPSAVPPGVLGAGGEGASVGPLAITGASFGPLPLAVISFIVGISSLWAGRRMEGGGPQQ